MNRDQIRALALANGFTLRDQPDGSQELNSYVYDFAMVLMEAEREACAKLCEDLKARSRNSLLRSGFEIAAGNIRARGWS